MANAAVQVPAIGGVSPAGGGEQPFGSVLWGGVDKFVEALNGARVGTSAVGTSGSTEEIKESVFQKILRPLGEFRSNFDSIIGAISNIVSTGNIGMKELIQIQFQLTQLSYMNDVTAKTADKVSQGTQTLFRNQG
ncbi:MAG: hypothetical protein LBB38_01285 [Puniceicoccales bacterium]|jgi:hypothetical protein|nr:hypothetical protein [Puniceicoccales bacterium]